MSDEITLHLPGPDAPGFLRRVQEVRAFLDAGRGIGVVDMWIGFADYLLSKGFVSAPDGVDAREALYDLPQSELSRALFALAGVDIPKAVNPPNGG